MARVEEFDVVFAGGGVKGVAFVGALEVLLHSGHRLRRLVGTSAGAITATCLAAAYSPEEMLAVARARRAGKPCFCAFLDPPTADDFPAKARENSEIRKLLDLAMKAATRSEPIKKLMGDSRIAGLLLQSALDELHRPLLDALLVNALFVQFFAFVEAGALFTDQRFREWMSEQLRHKGFDDGITLKDFHARTHRDLSLVATDTTEKRLLILNHRTAPKCPVVWAVRMSMGIPFAWPEVAWRNEWGPYRGRAITGNLVVDGGVLSNFPLRLLVDRADPDFRQAMDWAARDETRSLGLLLDERKDVPGAADSEPQWKAKVLERISRLIDTMSAAWDQGAIERHRDEVCAVGTRGFGALEFDMKEERMELLVNSGRCAMTTYLKDQKLALK